MSAVVLRGDAAHLPLPDGSVDLIVTLAAVLRRCGRTPTAASTTTGQIGCEATPRGVARRAARVHARMGAGAEAVGSIFVNLGDKYQQRGQWRDRATRLDGEERGRKRCRRIAPRTRGWPPRKSLLGLPWRYALGCMDDLGLILRAEIIWAKPNGAARVGRPTGCPCSRASLPPGTKQPRYFSGRRRDQGSRTQLDKRHPVPAGAAPIGD